MKRNAECGMRNAECESVTSSTADAVPLPLKGKAQGEGSGDVDWAAVKAEYITTRAGLRELAEKYKISFTTLSRRCAREKWVEARRQIDDDSTTEIVKKTARKNSSVRNKLYSLAEKVLEKIDLVVEGIDKDTDTKTFREITGSLKDLKIVLDVKSTADAKEQRERIKKLQRETVAETGVGDLEVEFKDYEEWAE